MTPKDPAGIIAASPMSRFQIVAVSLCVFLFALDGFDILAISFAAPGISEEWDISRSALGVVLSMELIGMAIGSLTLGGLADRIGRRPTALICLAIMTSGMFLASLADSVTSLSAFRFYTGLGIGGILAAINALAAEYANERRRAMAVSFMAAGYPIGAIVGGAISAVLLTQFDWRSIFVFGGLVNLMVIPLVWAFLPESVAFLSHKRPRRAHERINAILKRMGHRPVETLGPAPEGPRKPSLARLFRPDLARLTILLTLAYFAHIMTFYFFLKWIPKLVADMGFAASLAGGVLVWASVGGAVGGFLLGLLTQRFGLRPLTIAAMLAAVVGVVVFGSGQPDLVWLSTVAAIVGFFTNAAIVGMYAVFAQTFPTEARAGGTGFVIGVGRGGAALGPILAGVLFDAGVGLQGVAIAMAAGSAIGALALLVLPRASALNAPRAT